LEIFNKFFKKSRSVFNLFYKKFYNIKKMN
jgi:hypothetical protein